MKYRETNPQLTDLIYKVIVVIEECEDVKIKIDYYDIYIKTPSTRIELWNANKYFGWLSRGSVNGRSFTDIQPSNAAMFDFKECLKKHGYNIHVPKESDTIEPFDVKC